MAVLFGGIARRGAAAQNADTETQAVIADCPVQDDAKKLCYAEPAFISAARESRRCLSMLSNAVI